MALKSPRFAGSPRLQNAANNSPAMGKGEKGEPVRIIQQALIDLGFPMPISVRKFGSPDGIYGAETVAKISEFQKKHSLGIDGITGRNTMAKLDELLPTAGAPLPPLPANGNFSHKVRLHLRTIDTPTISEFTQLAVAQEIYKQYGIEIEMSSGMSLFLDSDEQLKLKIVDGQCKWDQVSDEQRLLQNKGREGVGPNDIVVYFATTLMEDNGDTLQGCAGHVPGRPACMVAASAFDKTTMAHEVGHVLLGSSFTPVHTTDTKNLMTDAPLCTGNPATLTDDQLAQIRKSPSCIKL
jgi:peptidoglycan hydrolase-like protein with peptidoglycan-binding domain